MLQSFTQCPMHGVEDGVHARDDLGFGQFLVLGLIHHEEPGECQNVILFHETTCIRKPVDTDALDLVQLFSLLRYAHIRSPVC